MITLIPGELYGVESERELMQTIKQLRDMGMDDKGIQTILDRSKEEKNSNKSYTISGDGENFFISFPSRFDAIQVGLDEYADQEEFYIGEMYEPEVTFLKEESIADEILDGIRHSLYDEFYEEAMDHFVVTDEQYQKLADSIKAAVDKWIEDEGIKAGFSVVRNVEKVRRANI